jgi:hypothetical protein
LLPNSLIIAPVFNWFQETKKNRNGTAPHSAWRNYDDLNEYFWKVDCFQLGWPMREDGDFFKPSAIIGRKFSLPAVRVLYWSSSFLLYGRRNKASAVKAALP